MTADQAIVILRRLISERNKGTLSTADYRHLRARLLDGLVGRYPSTFEDPTRPRPVPAAAAAASPARPRRTAAWRLAIGGAILLSLIGAICWRAF